VEESRASPDPLAHRVTMADGTGSQKTAPAQAPQASPERAERAERVAVESQERAVDPVPQAVMITSMEDGDTEADGDMEVDGTMTTMMTTPAASLESLEVAENPASQADPVLRVVMITDMDTEDGVETTEAGLGFHHQALALPSLESLEVAESLASPVDVVSLLKT